MYLEEAAALRANPGRWAFIRDKKSVSKASQMADAIRSGRLVAFRPLGDYEAVSRTVDGEYRVYARYIGE